MGTGIFTRNPRESVGMLIPLTSIVAVFPMCDCGRWPVRGYVCCGRCDGVDQEIVRGCERDNWEAVESDIDAAGKDSLQFTERSHGQGARRCRILLVGRN
jgi:hypothetical protein